MGGAGELAQWVVMVPAAKPDLSSTPGTTLMAGGEKKFPAVFLDLHGNAGARGVCTYASTRAINKSV